MKKIRIFCCVLLTLLSNVGAFAQADTSVMLQGFNWLSHNNNWYITVGTKITDIKAARIDAIWLPPPSDAASNEGYLPRELYKLNTQYGTQVQLQTLINNLHNTNIKVLADIVINHRVGLLNWGDLTNPTWGCWAVTSDDEWTGACGNPDTGMPFAAARDLDHTNTIVRADLKTWMNWLKNTIGFDGWRYDLVPGYSAGYIKEYNDATSPYFSVGENWNGDKNVINNWINGTQGSSAAFDFALKGVLHNAVNGNYSLLSESGNAPGVIGMNPSKAVTFIDNHDTGSPQALWPFPGNKVMQGYAYILTHPGIPMVFWDHLYDWGLHDEIANIIKVRKNNGLNSTSTISVQQAQTDLYAAIIDDKVAMKIGPGSWTPGSGYTLRASGIDYAVWDKNGTSLPVTYTSLDVVRTNGDEVSVTWNVTGEISMQQYEVERSTDGIHFITIRTITSLGTKSYNVMDSHASTGVAYYRIKGVNLDGGVDYSSMEDVAAMKGSSGIMLYPNPVNTQEELSVQFVNQEQGKFQLRLYNYLGQVVLQTCLEIASGYSLHSLNLSQQFSPGYYQVEIVDESGNHTMQKLVVQ